MRRKTGRNTRAQKKLSPDCRAVVGGKRAGLTACASRLARRRLVAPDSALKAGGGRSFWGVLPRDAHLHTTRNTTDTRNKNTQASQRVRCLSKVVWLVLYIKRRQKKKKKNRPHALYTCAQCLISNVSTFSRNYMYRTVHASDPIESANLPAGQASQYWERELEYRPILLD